MRRNWLWTWLLAALPLAGALAGCGGGDADEAAKVKLQQACETLCEKGYDPPCGGFTVDQCKASCPQLEAVLDQQYGGACLPESADFYACAATLEYTCGEYGPQPVSGSGCYTETVAMQECIQAAPCKSYCATKSECDGSDVGGCETECKAKLAELDSTGCDNDYEDLLLCQGGGGLVCEGGATKTEGCDSEISSYGSCVGYSGDPCVGYCFIKAQTGCGDETEGECNASCGAELDAANAKGCGSQLESLRGCQQDHGLDCDGGEPSIVGCSEEAWQYQSCMEGA